MAATEKMSITEEKVGGLTLLACVRVCVCVLMINTHDRLLFLVILPQSALEKLCKLKEDGMQQTSDKALTTTSTTEYILSDAVSSHQRWTKQAQSCGRPRIRGRGRPCLSAAMGKAAYSRHSEIVGLLILCIR